jgi:hypothetical protein
VAITATLTAIDVEIAESQQRKTTFVGDTVQVLHRYFVHSIFSRLPIFQVLAEIKGLKRKNEYYYESKDELLGKVCLFKH